MTKEDKELARQCAQLRFTPSSSSALLTLRNTLGVGIHWRQSQVASLNQRERRALSKLGPNTSTAAKLVEAFDRHDDVNYLYVTYSPSAGLLTMSSTLKKQVVRKVNWDNSELLQEDELKNMHSLNHLGTDGTLLLIFMFASTEEIRLAMLGLNLLLSPVDLIE
jgi:hypothetical protein